VVPAGDSVWSILYRWQRSTVTLACTMIRVAIVAVRRNKERFPLITASLDSKEATVPFPPIYHEHNHDSKHNPIECIGILPRDEIYLPLAGSLLPIHTTYLYPGWPKLQGRIKSDDTHVPEGPRRAKCCYVQPRASTMFLLLGLFVTYPVPVWTSSPEP
jgi:hypothetical protein